MQVELSVWVQERLHVAETVDHMKAEKASILGEKTAVEEKMTLLKEMHHENHKLLLASHSRLVEVQEAKQVL
jgi:hypothetical protein